MGTVGITGRLDRLVPAHGHRLLEAQPSGPQSGRRRPGLGLLGRWASPCAAKRAARCASGLAVAAGTAWNRMGIARHPGPGVPCRRVSGGREPPRHRRLRHIRARCGACCPPASVRRAAIRGDLTGRAASANAPLETITRGSRRTARPSRFRSLAGGSREASGSQCGFRSARPPWRRSRPRCLGSQRTPLRVPCARSGNFRLGP